MLSLRQSLATIGTPAPIRIPHDKSIPCKSLRDTLIAWNRIPYALLIIAPQEFIEAVQRLADHKNNTGIRTKILSLEHIYQSYPGRDEAEKVKRCLALFNQNSDVKYAMLVGDCDKFPVRYTKWWNPRVDPISGKEEDLQPEFRTLYAPTDLYYAALFKEDGSFDDWDGDGDGYFGECPADSTNPDGIYGIPFLAGGRVLASEVAEVEVYVSKVINYETEAYGSSWAKAALLIATTDWRADACQHHESIAKDYLAEVRDFKVYKLYQAGHPCVDVVTESPNPTTINAYMNQGVGLVSYIGHGNSQSWGIPGEGYGIQHIQDLSNAGKLPFVLSNGCHTAQYSPVPPITRYVDVGGNLHAGTGDHEVFNSTPPQPACLQPSDDVDIHYDSMAEEMTVKRATGAVAYIGSTITGGDPFLEISRSFYQAIYREGKTLGSAWCSALAAYHTAHPRPNFGVWRYELFGDPSLRVGGISHLEHWEKIPNSGKTDVAVSAVVFKDKLYLFSKGIEDKEDKRIYVNSATDRTHWSGYKEVSGSGTTDVAVSAVVFKDKLYLFSKGIADKHIYVNSTTDGSSWSGWKEIPGGGTTDVAVSAVVFKDKLYLFSKGIGDKHIYVNSTTDGSSWSGFGHVPNSGTTDVAVSAVVFKDKLYLFSKGIENQRIYINSTTDGSSWSVYKEVPGGGTTDVAVGVAVWDGLRLMAKGIDDKGIYFHRTMNGENWAHFGFQGGPTSTTPVGVSFSRNLYVFCVSSLNHRIYCRVLFWVG